MGTESPTPVGFTPTPTMYYMHPAYPYSGNIDENHCAGLKGKHCRNDELCVWNVHRNVCNHINAYAHPDSLSAAQFKRTCKSIMNPRNSWSLMQQEYFCRQFGCKYKSTSRKCKYMKPKCKRIQADYICARITGCWVDMHGQCRGKSKGY